METPVRKKVALALREERMSRSWEVYSLGPSSKVRAILPGELHLFMIVPYGTLPICGLAMLDDPPVGGEGLKFEGF